MKEKFKLLSLLLSAILIFGAIGFVGCDNTGKVEPPAPTYAVQSVTIRYNNAAVNGTLAVDISANTVQFVADVQKDDGADGTVTFTSSKTAVATVNNSGLATLVGEGETVITAQAGGKQHAIVLVVADSSAGTALSYDIIVNGGTASASKADKDTLVTLTPTVPDHKVFKGWQYSVDNVWTNGNSFKMPNQKVTVTAIYEDMLYTLNVVGGKLLNGSTPVEGEDGGNVENGDKAEYDMSVYHLKYDTPVALEAIDNPAGKIFVGWDYGMKNNRKGDVGAEKLTFAMPGETTTVWAVYSDFTPKVWDDGTMNGATIASGTAKITDGVIAGTSTPDPVLEGMSGFRIPYGSDTPAQTGWLENIWGSHFESFESGTQCMKAILRNNSPTYDITIELAVSYFGNRGASGYITVPAGQTVTHHFIVNAGIAGDTNPWWGIMVRKNIGGSGLDYVMLDVVLGRADLYPDGDKSLAVSGKADYVALDSTATLGAGFVGHINKANNANGMSVWACYNSQMSSTTDAYVTRKITNMPAFDATNPTQTVYIKVSNVCNTSNTPKASYQFGVGTSVGTMIKTQVVEFDQTGDSVVLKLEIPRSAADTEYYFGVFYTGKYSESVVDYAYNIIVQMTYNNVMNYEEA